MSSTTLSPKASERDDDLLDFLIAHHAKADRSARCFGIGGRHVCARCLGWIGGAALAAALLWHGSDLFLTARPYILLAPLPAFADWGGRKLGFFDSGKAAAFATGSLMGLAVPGFALGVLGLDAAALAGFVAYLALFLLVTWRARRCV